MCKVRNLLDICKRFWFKKADTIIQVPYVRLKGNLILCISIQLSTLECCHINNRVMVAKFNVLFPVYQMKLHFVLSPKAFFLRTQNITLATKPLTKMHYKYDRDILLNFFCGFL
jgi:hypothetical protein